WLEAVQQVDVQATGQCRLAGDAELIVLGRVAGQIDVERAVGRLGEVPGDHEQARGAILATRVDPARILEVSADRPRAGQAAALDVRGSRYTQSMTVQRRAAIGLGEIASEGEVARLDLDRATVAEGESEGGHAGAGGLGQRPVVVEGGGRAGVV